MPAAAVIQTVQTQVEVLRSRGFREQVIKNQLDSHPGIESALPAVKISNQEDTEIITVSAENQDPQIAASVCNAVVEEYTQSSRKAGEAQLMEAQAFLKERLQAARRQLTAADKALLAKNREARDVTNIGAANEHVRAANEMRADLRKFQQGLLAANAKISSLQDELQIEPETISETTSRLNPDWQNLDQLLSEARKERAQLLLDFLPTSQRVQDAEDRISTIRRSMVGVPPMLTQTRQIPNPARPPLEAQIRSQKREQRALKAQVKQLSEITQTEDARVGDFGVLEVELNQIKRERDHWVKQIEDYDTQLQQVEIRLKATPITARVLDSAIVPSGPIRPKKAQGIALSMLIGLVLGVGVAFLQEFLDDRVNTSEEVERLTALPTLGVVPIIAEERGRLISGQDGLSPITESYRSLRTAIHFMSVDSPLRSLLVTSGHSGEGKSVTSVNLAMAMAMEGRKVILVDADLRRPSLHRMLDLSDSPGLSSLLAGQATLDEALQDTHVEGLRVVTSGPLPPNPAEMLYSEAMDRLLEELQELADVVVFDTPPTLPATDSQVLATKVNGVVLVVEAGQAKKGALKHARDLLAQSRARLLGVVLNKIDQGGKGYYYHYYYRGSYNRYGYRYGYGPGGHGGGYGYGQERRLTDSDSSTGEGQPSLPERLGDWE